MGPLNLNGRILPGAANKSDANIGAYDKRKSSEPRRLSDDDLQKIQVVLISGDVGNLANVFNGTRDSNMSETMAISVECIGLRSVVIERRTECPEGSNPISQGKRLVPLLHKNL